MVLIIYNTSESRGLYRWAIPAVWAAAATQPLLKPTAPVPKAAPCLGAVPVPLLHARVLSALSPRCSSCPKQSKNNSPKTHSQVLRRKQELLDPNCCPLGNHRGTCWLWWNPENEGKGIPPGWERIPGWLETLQYQGYKCQVHLGQGGPIQKPEHPPTPTCG